MRRVTSSFTPPGDGLVSVIIPTYNRVSLLLEALQSVRAQSYKNIQIIVVDDGSVDNTREVAASLEDVLYVHQQNGGQATARNSGLARATGEYLCSLDSDDLWQPDFLERSLNALETLSADFVFANWAEKDATGLRQSNYFQRREHLWKSRLTECEGWKLLEASAAREMYIDTCASPSSSLLFRRKTVAKYGWTTGLHVADDWCLLWDIVLRAPCRVAYTMDKLWIKRVTGDNICDQVDKAKLLQMLEVDDLETIFFKSSDVLTSYERARLYGRLAHNRVKVAGIKAKTGDIPAAFNCGLVAAMNIAQGVFVNPRALLNKLASR